MAVALQVSPEELTIGVHAADSQAEVVRELQSRIRGMQRQKLDTRALPTNPAIADLLPGGALAAGSAYSVAQSTTLALSLLQGPSAAGAWCAVIGMPDLGVESAAGLGIDLERLVLVPYPGEQWMPVVSALVDVVSVVMVRPPTPARIGDAVASKLGSRLRQREAVLISVGDWPRAEARLSVTASNWTGIGSGFGHLAGRQVSVSSVAAAWAGRAKSRRLWLPDAAQQVRAVEPVGIGQGAGVSTGAGATASSPPMAVTQVPRGVAPSVPAANPAGLYRKVP